MKKVLIIGAGPAGLTAAYELLSKSSKYEVTVFEESDSLGGISRTVNYKGNRMDMGGHRFFSKSPEVNEWWESMLPMQGAPSKDDIML
nr:FAD-dependent oxidoreductase [Fretibacterium sp.]